MFGKLESDALRALGFLVPFIDAPEVPGFILAINTELAARQKQKYDVLRAHIDMLEEDNVPPAERLVYIQQHINDHFSNI